MPLDPAFVADCPYGPGALLFDEILEVDQARSLIRLRLPTDENLPITRDQRADPRRHPRHVAGGLMVHLTGVAGFAHAYYLLGLRHHEGWIGYGTHIHSARFRHLAHVEAPLEITCQATQVRRFGGNYFVRYTLRFQQGDKVVYEGDQSAIFHRPTLDGAAVGEGGE